MANTNWRILGGCTIDGDAGPAVLSQNDGVVESLTIGGGAGDYTLNLQPNMQVDALECLILCAVRGGGAIMVNVNHVSDIAKQIQLFDDAGAPVDGDVDVLILARQNLV